MTSVIVVDDNEDIVDSISELLEIYGINVVGKGHNGLDAVKLFETLRPDVVLLDLVMPEYDGLYALKKIRKIDPKSIVIVVTGGPQGSASDDLDSLEPTEIIFKPFDVNVLSKIIFKVTNHSMPFKVQYSFKNDSKLYTCIMTNDQYENFKTLPIIQQCEIVEQEENLESYKPEIEEALNLAAKNDISHIQKLSQII